uniref:Uncharacterized protein n=1 Tax=Sciurus vulgaris TaxID=55149 RepID=A0A8D2CR25_SCIVU
YKDSIITTEEAAAEIAGMPDKKKKLLKEKKLAVLVLTALEHSGCALEECEGGGCHVKPPTKETKTKPLAAPQENAMVPLNPRKKPSSKEELVSSDFEETAGSASLPRGRNLHLRKTGDPEDDRTFSSRKEPVSNGPEKTAAGIRTSSTKKNSQKHPRKIRMDIPWGRGLPHSDISLPISYSLIKINSQTHK